jgi:hypothetical protein
VLPHQPLTEQQLPKALPEQVYAFVPPHDASVETFVGIETVAEMADEGRIIIVELLLGDDGVGLLSAHVPKPG